MDSAEKQPNQERWQQIAKQLNTAMSSPTPIDRHFQTLREQSNLTSQSGFVFFETLDDFKAAFGMVQGVFGLTDEYVQQQIEHEQDHIQAARKIYQENATYGYGIHFLQTPDQRLGFAPMYLVIPHLPISQQDAMENSKRIAGAPQNPSVGDKIVGDLGN
jgi:hypothetical protein